MLCLEGGTLTQSSIIKVLKASLVPLWKPSIGGYFVWKHHSHLRLYFLWKTTGEAPRVRAPVTIGSGLVGSPRPPCVCQVWKHPRNENTSAYREQPYTVNKKCAYWPCETLFIWYLKLWCSWILLYIAQYVAYKSRREHSTVSKVY